MSRLVTTPPANGQPVALYDGRCRICTSQMGKLSRFSRGRLASVSFQDDAALAAFPGLTYEACLRELKVVDRDGSVFGGAEAIARSLVIARPVLGQLARVYYVPGLRWLFDRLYAVIARSRYRLFGRSEACEDDACSLR
ncbi:MAG: DUF393 domain-containing protein [Thermoanaerobaculia bacterium]